MEDAVSRKECLRKKSDKWGVVAESLLCLVLFVYVTCHSESGKQQVFVRISLPFIVDACDRLGLDFPTTSSGSGSWDSYSSVETANTSGFTSTLLYAKSITSVLTTNLLKNQDIIHKGCFSWVQAYVSYFFHYDPTYIEKSLCHSVRWCACLTNQINLYPVCAAEEETSLTLILSLEYIIK